MSSKKTQHAVAGYMRRGLRVVPVPNGGKRPKITGWQKLRLTEEDIPNYWSNGQKVGVLTGEPSGWRVDVDLDCREATAVADRFLPDTLISGRHGNPRSHWWYVAEGIESATFKEQDDSVVLEIRANGRQTLVPPSIHPSGEPYVWNNIREPTVIEAEELTARCHELATAALIARRVPPNGGRHDFALAVCGLLLKRLDEETTLRIVRGAWHAAGADSREALQDLEGIVRDTARKIGAGEPVVGGPTLEESAPGVVKLLRKWWGWSGGVEVLPIPEPPPWPEPAEEAYHGLAGDVVRAIEPHTEADPVAVLANLVCAFGNAIGRGAHFRVGADEHHLKINAGLVGETSKGRKGMSEGHVRRLMRAVDEEWEEDRVMSGLSSGEGLIYEVRDELWGVNGDGQEVLKDPGASDKRLLVSEPELARVLKVMTRETNTLSAIIRQAWDGGRLRVMTRTNPLKATDVHISIVGHISMQELLRHLTDTEVASGFANRFLWLLVRRSKELAFGGKWHTVDVAPLIRRLSKALEFGKSAGEIVWGESAKDAWQEVYGPLSKGKPGLFGAVVGRAEAQTVRLAALYAVLDLSKAIQFEHLQAALALWQYAEESARYIFGDATGDPVADRIAEALRAAGKSGMSRTEIRDLFKRHKKAEQIDQALFLLLNVGRVHRVLEETAGRSSERWFLK